MSMSESKGTPFSKKTPTSMKGTCVKVRKQGEYRYSSSPLGKRIDIYETSETELDDDNECDQNIASDNAKDACKSTSRAESSVKEEISVIEADDNDQLKSSKVSQNLDFQQKVDSDEDSVVELLRNKDKSDIAG